MRPARRGEKNSGQTSEFTRASVMGKTAFQPHLSRRPQTQTAARPPGFRTRKIWLMTVGVCWIHEAEDADDGVERGVREGDVLGINALEAHVGDDNGVRRQRAPPPPYVPRCRWRRLARRAYETGGYEGGRMPVPVATSRTRSPGWRSRRASSARAGAQARNPEAVVVLDSPLSQP